MYAPEYPIRTERLLLRPLTLDDAAPMLVYKSDADAVRYVPYGQLSFSDIEERIQTRWSTTRFEKQDDAVCLGIEERETGRLVGDVVLFWRSERDREGEVGYILDPAQSGKGYATEAVAALLELGFEGLGLHRIAARIDERNTSSARVVDRLGFRQEARLVESSWFKEEWTTLLIYGLLDREWRAGRAAGVGVHPS